MEDPVDFKNDKIYLLLQEIFRSYMDAAEEEIKRTTPAYVLELLAQQDEAATGE